MLEYFHVENFKNLADVEARFGDVNVVIGPNGCGKSSLLQAVDFLRAFFRPSIEDYLSEKGFDYSDLPNLRQAGKAIRWDIRASLEPDAEGRGGGLYEYSVSVRKWRYLGIGRERLVYSPPGGDPVTLLDREGRKIKQFADEPPTENIAFARMPRSLIADLDERSMRSRAPEMFRFRDWITNFRAYLSWDPKVLRRKDRGKHHELGESGEHLAPILAHLRRTDPPGFVKLIQRLRRLFPTVSDIAVKGGRGWGWQQIALIEGNGRSVHFNSQQMSDGVLRLLAIATFLYSKVTPSLITFEEPENGIHPQLVTSVIQMLREISQRKAPHRCQVFFTTHNPYVLDEFKETPEQVYIMERGRPLEGASLVRLSEKKDIGLVNALFRHSLGEAWYSGVIGGAAGVS